MNKQRKGLLCTPGIAERDRIQSCIQLTYHLHHIITQWNLSKTATCGPAPTDLYKEVAALQR